MTAHVYRDTYGDELTIVATPEDGQIALYEKCEPGAEPVAIIYTSKPVTLSTEVREKVLVDKASFERGWRYGMLQAGAILLVLVVLKLLWPA